MNPNLLISTIILFVLSLVGCIILTLLSKKLNENILRILSYIHFSLIAIAVVVWILNHEMLFTNFTILLAFCSGLLLAGWTIRSQASLLFKIYASVYLLSILLFFYSPSLLFYTINGNFSKMQKIQEFSLKENYYLVEQKSMLSLNNKFANYKLIQKFGIYKKTLKRDIDFGERIYNVQIIEFTPDTIVLKGTTSNKLIEIGFRISKKENGIIQKRKS